MITNEDISEADDIFDPEYFDNYFNMEIALDMHDNGTEFGKVNNRLKEKDSRPIGIAEDNPILDTMMYEVEYADGYKTAMTANTLASKLFSQVRTIWTSFCIIQCHHRFAYRPHINQGGKLFYLYVQWNQEEERDHKRMGKFHTMERQEFYLELN